ncbi:MAG: ATP-binding protein [Ruminococcus sp.]|nr:ATP-binding protein [Ruminococcus sp.]MCM1381328.1 ATP-binding protein [Muribaculaceae bacterium]MCM1479870.1 ATP-binding protein [Muribaculaceae bacterium]
MGIIEEIQQMKENNVFEQYIDFIQFPKFKNLEPNTRINFDFPLTVLVGKNGSNKSSVLTALYGAPLKYSTGNFWFSTDTDPIYEGKGERNRFFYQYTLDKNTSGREVLKQRTKRSKSNAKKEDPDYWETAEPVLSIGMKKGERNEPVKKEVIYIDFRSELSAFDKYFYFGEPKKEKKQDFLRRKSKYLKRAFANEDVRYPGLDDKLVLLNREELTDFEIKAINKILAKDYTSIIITEHKFYGGVGSSVRVTTNSSLKYSEANAGSGEIAVIQLVHKVINANPNSLILLDEPEVSLHPSAQKNIQIFLLDEIRKKHHQIVLSTHSPAIIKGLPTTAIKLFTTKSTGQFHIDESIDYREAFYELEEYAIDKIKIICEDYDAKSLIVRALKKLGLDKYFVVDLSPGGADTIMKYIVPTYALNDDVHNNVFFIFDGDKYCNGCNINDLTVAQSQDEKFLEEKVKAAYSGNLLKANVDGGKNGGNVEQKCEVYRKYIQYHYNNIGYLPNGKIPEEIILSCNCVRSKYSNIVNDYDEITYKNAKEILYRISEVRNDSDINQTFEALSFDLFDEGNSEDLNALLKLLRNIYKAKKICHDTIKKPVTV